MQLQIDKSLSKKAYPPAAAKSTQDCENSRFLTTHNIVACTRMAPRRPGAFAFSSQRHRPRCRFSPLSFRPQQKLNKRKMQDGNYHQKASAQFVI